VAGGVSLDVTQEADWTRAVDSVLAQYGRLDGLVNAAGSLGGTEQGVLTAKPSQWLDVLNTHLVGTWLGCREVISRASPTRCPL